jgi:hypothetical protein
MKPYLLVFLTAITFGLHSCKLFKNDASEKDETPSIIVQQGFVKPDNSASFDLIKTSLEGNILTIEVSYSGGCNEHEFKLYFDGNYKKSLPPKADFILTHDNKGDACRSIENKTMKFDISKSQYAGQKEIMVSVEGFQELKYSY